MRLLLGLGVLLVACTSIAAPVRWTLHDVTFYDGGIINGSFIFDPSLPINDQVYNVAIASTVGGSFTGADYSFSRPSNTPWAVGFTTADWRTDPTDWYGIMLDLGAPMTIAADIISLRVPDTPTQNGPNSFEMLCLAWTCGAGSVIRQLSGGYLASTAVVPLPFSGMLFVSGLAILLATQRRDARSTISAHV
ncbi:MAG: hypothetical protein Q8N51_00710 [Gammaproteobacteria bacterium]|nr:hypothetical protein [Gammaproteobacteria bacterium]